MIVKNRGQLEERHGVAGGIVLGALEAAVSRVEPGALVRRAVQYDSNAATVTVRDMRGRTTEKFGDFDDAYVVGAGKAAAAMAGALCSILKEKVAKGAINVPLQGSADAVAVGDGRIEVTHASHPVPDGSGVRGTIKILRTVGRAREGDIVFVIISGGGSALMPLPAKGLSLADKQQMTSNLLASGASIHEVNAVRKHLSLIKGGQLARHATAAGCRVVALILSDVVGDDLSVIASGPTSPDPSTFADALGVVKKYGITQPRRAIRHLEKGAGGKIEETPKPGDPAFERVHNLLIGNNRVACMAAASYLRRKGLRTRYLGSSFGGPAHELGMNFAGLDVPPCSAVVAGGETTVRLGIGKTGRGGRNQEAALAFALASHNCRVTAAFMGTDGIDGNSDAAGALVSPRVCGPARKMGGQRYLARHDSYHALKRLSSLIFTGPTGTNVNDIAVLVNYRDVA